MKIDLFSEMTIALLIVDVCRRILGNSTLVTNGEEV